MFQSHAGSIEAKHAERGFEFLLPFQSHAGSIEAGYAEADAEFLLSVSIPRWFD